MERLVSKGAKLHCSQGTVAAYLDLPRRPYLFENVAIANIEDHKPFVNIPPFGMCRAFTNPAVAATGGQPVPCVPPSFSEWVDVSTYIYQVLRGRRLKVLTERSRCVCLWTGIVTIRDPNTTVTTRDRPLSGATDTAQRQVPEPQHSKLTGQNQ